MMRLLLVFMIAWVIAGCKDVPYQEKAMANSITESPVIEIKLPVNNAYLSQNNILIKGSVSKPELVKSMRVAYRGMSENSEKFHGTQDFSVKAEQKDWSVDVGKDLGDGDYVFSLSFRDIHGTEQSLPEVKITIDQQAPEILGALDGVPQASYLQETIHYQQRFFEDETNARYEIEPIDDASQLNYSQIPIIYRWLNRINDEKTAPSYSIKLADGNEGALVKYSLGYECKPINNATKEALKKEDGTYEIKIIQSAADFDLSRDSEERARGKSYCLNIWAVDQAGNISNHKVEFIWKVIVPPVSLDTNTARYKAHRREDDISWLGPPVWKLFRNANPIVLKKDLVIGHVIMSNPFSSPISSKLELKKALNLKINERPYQISEKLVDIKFFRYDLLKNELGPEATLNDGSVIINAQKTIIAKIILTKEVPITGVVNPDDNFWRSFSLELGFTKTGNDRPLVDGLMLITRDPGTGTMSSEFAVPWGSDHDVRRRLASRSGT